MDRILHFLPLFFLLSCVSEFPLNEQKIYGSSQYGKVPVYSKQERDLDFKNFKENYGKFEAEAANENLEKDPHFFVFINKFLAQTEEFVQKYSNPYKVESEDSHLLQTENKVELQDLHTKLLEMIVNRRKFEHQQLPLGGRYHYYQKILLENIYHSGKVQYEDLSLALLEALIHISDESGYEQISSHLNTIDAFAKKVPLNFSSEYFKISLDNNLEEKWQRPLRLDSQIDYKTFLNEGKGHAHISALNFLLAHRRFKNEQEYHLEHPLVIFDRGHILPAFVKFEDGKINVHGILPYARGKGIINYGEPEQLSNAVHVVLAHDFIFSYIFKDFYSPSDFNELMNAAQKKSSRLYGLTTQLPWNSSPTELYFGHKSSRLPENRPLISEISVDEWYAWLDTLTKEKTLASDFTLSE